MVSESVKFAVPLLAASETTPSVFLWGEAAGPLVVSFKNVTLRRSEMERPLSCFPHGGSSLSWYGPFAELILHTSATTRVCGRWFFDREGAAGAILARGSSEVS